MGGHARPVGILQASQARPALRARTPLSLRDISPRSGESPLKGAPFARAKPAREASPSGEVAAEQAGRVQPVDGGHSKVAGRACPAPTDCRESLCTRGAARPYGWRKVRDQGCRGRRPRRPAGGSRPLPTRQTVQGDTTARLRAGHARPLRTAVSGSGGSGELPNFKTEEGSAALRTDSNTASV